MSGMIRSSSGTYHVRQNEIIHTKNEPPVKAVKCVIHFLDDTSCTLEVDRRSKAQVLLGLVYEHLDLIEKDYFSLQYEDDSDGSNDGMRWIDPLKSVKRQLKSDPPYHLYFRVKFYVTDPSRLQEEFTRYHFFLQIKNDILDGRLVCPSNVATLLASYAVQSELGDFASDEHAAGYLKDFQFVPDQDQGFESEVVRYHQQHKGQTPADAELNFLERVKHLEMYGVDLHGAKDSSGVDIQLGVTANGLVVFRNHKKVDTFTWNKIIKISFKRKQFFVQTRSDSNEQADTIIGFNMFTYRSCKTLWKSCVEYHSFFRLHHIKPAPRKWYQLGSKFRYSGRTEYEAQQDSKRLTRGEKQFQRTGSNTLRHTISGTTLPSRMATERRSASSYTPLSNLTSSNSNGVSNQPPKPALRTSNSFSARSRLSLGADRGSHWTNSFHVPNTRRHHADGDGQQQPVYSNGPPPLSQRDSFAVKRDSIASRDHMTAVSLPASNHNSTRDLTMAGNSLPRASGLDTSSGGSYTPRAGYTPRANPANGLHRSIPNNINHIPQSSLSHSQTNIDSMSGQQQLPRSHSNADSLHRTAPPARAGGEHSKQPLMSSTSLPRAGVAAGPMNNGSAITNGYGQPTSGLVGHTNGYKPQHSMQQHSRSGSAVSHTTSSSVPVSSQFSAATAVPVNGEYTDLPNDNGFLDNHSLVTIRMSPDEQGRFGFNVKGGIDQGMPIIVSRVATGMPADICIPRLNEGDQILFINGRDVTQHKHEQVVMYIRAAREMHSGELVLIVKPNVYVGEDYKEPEFQYVPETHRITSSGRNGLDHLSESLMLLREGLESGAATAQFDQLYRRKPGLTNQYAKAAENLNKNRYRDISPYDQTRVILRNLPTGDYINANYINMEIPGSGVVNRYIAAQGPLPNTCADFWEMVWQQQITLVVMLTALVERGRIKCHQYWPHLYETSDFGTLQLTCLKEKETRSFAFREFTLVNMETNEERHIHQMQYIAWPDHGVPDDSSDFLDFVIRVRQKRIGMVEPMLVHCSAGIGRTGVLITMETAMCLIEANQPVYPLDVVRQMRDQRAMLIQTSSQYQFVCEAILRVFQEGLVKPSDDFRN